MDPLVSETAQIVSVWLVPVVFYEQFFIFSNKNSIYLIIC